MEVHKYTPDGQHEHYYLTSSVSGHAKTNDGRLGLFAVGRAAMSNSGTLEIYVFGLTDAAVVVELEEVRLIGSRPEVPADQRSFELSRNERLQIVPETFAMSSYAPGWPITVVLTLNGTREQLDFALERRRAENYVEAVRLDAVVPRDAVEFERL
jgi:hypothetical protein